MTAHPSLLSFFFLQLLLAVGISLRLPGTGQWALLQKNIGISAMHMQLLPNDRVIIYDFTSFGPSQLPTPHGECRKVNLGLERKPKMIRDCTSHSAEYDIRTNHVRALLLKTDVWCSSGALTPDGTLVQSGGYGDGANKLRLFHPCNDDRCDWEEHDNGLLVRRWYPTSQILPTGSVFIVGGRNVPNYEFYPKSGLHRLPFLEETSDKGAENNLYPFVFLNSDGNLFIFANNRAILLNYKTNFVVRRYPPITGGDPRNYPSTGSAVLLPLTTFSGQSVEVEVMVCGGAPKGSYQSARKGKFVGALDSCGRININARSPQWVMEKMPRPRIMGDMTLLPNADVLIINGASQGSAGWELGRSPVLEPVLYRSDVRPNLRFAVLKNSIIPRMYHSTALLLRDGRILVGGSNPHKFYSFKGVLFPTELRLEAFSPPYLDKSVSNLRPTIRSTATKLTHGQKFQILFSVQGPLLRESIRVTLVAPSFSTHSFSMNQRLLVIGGIATKVKNANTFVVSATSPSLVNLAPHGYYMLFVVHQTIPSEGVWIHI